MSTFVYMTRCDGCGHCVDICPSDIMHIDENIRRAKNIEPNFCWECYSCVKACPNHAIDVRGYADFAPMGHSVRVRREEEKGTISWKIKFRNGTTKDFVSPITTKPWGKFIPKLADGEKIKQGELNSQRLYTEPEGLNIDGELPAVPTSRSGYPANAISATGPKSNPNTNHCLELWPFNLAISSAQTEQAKAMATIQIQ